MLKIILKLAKQTSWQLLGKVIASLLTIIILSLVTRSYGESGTGVFTLALTYLSYFGLAVDFGINAHLLEKFLDKDFSLTWRKLLGLRLFLSVILVFLAILVVYFWSNNQIVFKQLILVGIMAAILSPAISSSTSIIFQSKLRFDLSSFAWILGSLIEFMAIVLVVKFNGPIVFLMFSYVAGWLGTMIASLLLVRIYQKNILPILDFKFIKSILLSVWPISLTLILNTIYFRMDAFILSFDKSFVEVGIYNLSYQIFQSALVIPAYIMNGFYPMMIKYFYDNTQKFNNLLIKSFLIMFGIGILGSVLTFVFSPIIVGIITGGKGFIGSIEALRILSFGFPAFFGSSILMWALVVYKKYKTLLIIYGFGLLVNTLLNLVFIPQYSFFAASFITGISEYLILILQIMVLLRSKIK